MGVNSLPWPHEDGAMSTPKETREAGTPFLKTLRRSINEKS
jgi:hypothetical protein